MNKPKKLSILRTSLLAAMVAATFSAQAAGLGRLSVFSGIGEPLRAEVALSATAEEMGSLAARLASFKEFGDAGIEFMPVLAGLNFDIHKSADGTAVLRLRTAAPVNEPFLHFLLELSWASGRVVREYTFLLDPPETLRPDRPSGVYAPATLPSRPEKLPEAAPLTPPPAAEALAPVAGMQGEVTVKAGDTLGKIARTHKPDAVTLEQMLAALFNNNREVFDAGNMNRLRAGKILRLPDPAEVAAVDSGEARRLIVGQAREFDEYRRRLAAAAVAVPATDREAAPTQEVAGKIVPDAPAKAPAPVAKDKLEVSRTEAPKTAEAARQRAEEDLIARDLALREANERIAQLEKNLAKLQQLAEIKSQAGAQLQQQAEAVVAPPPDTTAKEEPVQPPVPATEAQAPQAPSAPAEEVAKPKEAAPAKPPVKPAPQPKAPPAPPPPEPSFMEENPELVLGGGGIVALLLAYLGYSAWRRKKQSSDEAAEDAPAGSDVVQKPAAEASETSSLAAGIAGGNDISIQGDFSEEGVLTTEENVDPVAEADVLMAYGRDAQAEEILKEGLRGDPERAAIYLKLLELYVQRKDVGEFESVAGQLRDLTRGQGADWEKAIVLADSLGIAHEAIKPADMTATTQLRQAAAVPAMAEGIVLSADTAKPFAPAAASEAAVGPGEPAAPATGTMDFDLDLGTGAGTKAPEVGEEPSGGAAGEPIGSLDFDLDLGSVSTPAKAEPAAAKPLRVEQEVASLDFDLGLPTAAPDETPEVPGSAAPATLSAQGGFPAAIDFSLDIDAEPSTGSSAEAAPMGLADLDLDLDVAPGASPAAAATPDFDLSLDILSDAGAPAKPEAIAEAAGDVGEVAGDPEVATKLELAQAYEEMGDREGARELLNEVLKEGSSTQQALARARLDQLGA